MFGYVSTVSVISIYLIMCVQRNYLSIKSICPLTYISCRKLLCKYLFVTY